MVTSDARNVDDVEGNGNGGVAAFRLLVDAEHAPEARDYGIEYLLCSEIVGVAHSTTTISSSSFLPANVSTCDTEATRAGEVRACRDA